MAQWLTLLIPAAAALAGVVLTQAWNTWLTRRQRRLEVHHTLWNERRATLHRFLTLLNQALDSTRAAVREGDAPEQRRLADDRREDRWAAAFESYLEIAIVFPEEATNRAWKHLQGAYSWRRAAIEAGDAVRAPRHEDLITALKPWLSLET
ncbi:hypothetical protein [Catenuloplanes indicus]|uniref:Uncharacterized protein n=1 Tax=Catenuloplanes indicus TaxID=137267 RepID=A0AAE3VUK7_9ACTN|nr:hypothetical protein [Catenuloplanes indicus]MDQ0364283.1 hypothetical protein [Catenuloplanes indicus]